MNRPLGWRIFVAAGCNSPCRQQEFDADERRRRDDVIEAFSTDRADQPLRMPILPGRPRKLATVTAVYLLGRFGALDIVVTASSDHCRGDAGDKGILVWSARLHFRADRLQGCMAGLLAG